MMRVVLQCLIVLVVLSGGLSAVTVAVAAQHVLSVELAEDHVDITSGFSGTKLVLFGVKGKGGDIAVILRGAKKDFVVRQKKQVVGAWVNRSFLKFEDVPVFYDVALSRAEEGLLSPEMLKAEGIGFASLQFDPADEDGLSEDDKAVFLKALIRNKQDDSMFPAHAKDVEFLSDSFFKVVFDIPSNVPVGQYVVEAFYIKNQRVVDRRVSNVRIGQAGFSAGVYQFAHSYSFLYSIATVVFAVVAGWLSNAVRKRK